MDRQPDRSAIYYFCWYAQNFVANLVCKILVYTSADRWNHVATKNNPADAGTRGMSAEVLQLISWVKGPYFLINSSFSFEPNKDDINITSNLASTKQSL